LGDSSNLEEVKQMWNPFRRKETRQTLEELLITGTTPTDTVTKEQALNIPSLSGCLNVITNTIASLPILLYKEVNGKVEPVEKDARVRLLNDSTQDSLNGWDWKRALIEDYLLEGSSFSYIKRNRNDVKSLHYVDNANISIQKSTDPINKNYSIHVNGMPYRDFEFIKLVRKTKDGITGQGIIKESNKILSMIYNSILFEEALIKTGGSKKGFLRSQGRLSKEAITELKMAWNNLYKTSSDNCIILNNGLEFQEASNTSVEMQLYQQKTHNSNEICKLFLVPPNILSGEASEDEFNSFIKVCIMPILSAFENALNKDLLLPSEKESFYFAFDTNELLKGSIESRYTAYEIGIRSGMLQLDEVRYKENLPPLGLDFIKLQLADVLFNPKTKEIYTPNTNQTANVENPSGNPNNGNTNPEKTNEGVIE